MTAVVRHAGGHAHVARRVGHWLLVLRAAAPSVLSLCFASSSVAAQPAPIIQLDRGQLHDEEFTRIGRVRELPDGTVLVSDPAEFRILHLDWRTRHVTIVGRWGQGPGEFQSIEGLVGIGADSTIVVDGGLQRWVVLRRGQVVATTKSYQWLQTPGLILVGGDRQARLLAVHTTLLAPSSETPDSIAVVLGRIESRHLDTVALLRSGGRRLHRIPAGGRATVALAANPLLVDEQAVLMPDGWSAFIRSNPYRVDWRSPNGAVTQGAPIPHELVRVDERVKREALSRLLPANRDAPTSALPDWPEYVPPFPQGAAFATHSGEVVIRQTLPSGFGSTYYDIVNRTAGLAGRIHLPPGERVVGFGSRSVYVAVTDRDGIERLRRHGWKR